MDIKTLGEAVARFRDARDWKQFHNPKDVATAIQIEAAELAELFLWKSPAEVAEFVASASGRDKISDELGDVFAFLLSLSDVVNIPLDEALLAKIKKNEAKYPADRFKGSAKKYNEV